MGLDFGAETFYFGGMSNIPISPGSGEHLAGNEAQIRLAQPQDLPRVQSLLRRHHYLGMVCPVGERLFYVAVKMGGGSGWECWCFARQQNTLRHRDKWIGWTSEQQRRRLALVVNNSRFLLLPQRTVPNLGSRVLKLALDRLSADWQQKYGHPVLVAETFVDPEQFCGTVYTAAGWQELGLTDGWGRHARDYYVKHDKPKRLFVRELRANARRSLQAEHLKPELATVEDKVPPRCTQRVGKLRSLAQLSSRSRVSRAHRVLSAVVALDHRGVRDAVRRSARAQGSGRFRQKALASPTPSAGHSTPCRWLVSRTQ